MTLGILSLSITQFEQVFEHRTYDATSYLAHSVIFISMATFLGAYAGCIASIAIAPHQSWRTAGSISVTATVVWIVYGFIRASNTFGTIGAASITGIVGAGAAYATAYRLFGRQAVPLK